MRSRHVRVPFGLFLVIGASSPSLTSASPNPPSHAAVTIFPDHWRLSFQWTIEKPPNFSPGIAVEFQVQLAPKDCFSRPLGGVDDESSMIGILHNLPEAASPYRDVWNYWWPSHDYFVKKVERCGDLSLLQEVYISALYYDFTEKSVANFAIGLRNAFALKADFAEKADSNIDYYFDYPLESQPTSACEGQAGKARASVSMQYFPNACVLPFGPTVFECPEIIGFTGCQGPSGATIFWLQRICAPTGEIQFTPYDEDMQKDTTAGQLGWPDGVDCIDNDSDDLFAAQPALMFGTLTGDCNDDPNLGGKYIGKEAYDQQTGTCSCDQPPLTYEDCDDLSDNDCNGLAGCLDMACSNDPSCQQCGIEGNECCTIGDPCIVPGLICDSTNHCVMQGDPCQGVTCPDDGDLCNDPEHCEGGNCTSGPALVCDPSEQCYSTIGCGCVDGATDSCYTGPPGTAGTGVCQEGVNVCASGSWGGCAGEIIPANENCLDGADNDCDGFMDCTDTDCSSLPSCNVNPAIIRLRACSLQVPTTTRVFTSMPALNYTFDMMEYANSGCFIVDSSASDSVAPSAEPAKSQFRTEFEAANPAAVLGKSAAFVEIAKSKADALNLPEAAYAHCALTGSRVETWYGLNYLLTPITAEGQQVIRDIASYTASVAIHPILYYDSLLPDIWYFWWSHWQSTGEECKIDTNGDSIADTPAVDIDGDGVADSPNDERWVPKQLETLDLVRSDNGVGIVAHVTDAAAACMFAPHLDGLDTELGTYVADADGARYGEARRTSAVLQAWELGSRFCVGGQPCYRAVFTSADPILDVQLDGLPFPWDRPWIWNPGDLIDQMKDDTARNHAAHVLAALVGAAAFPGTTYFWGIGPFPSEWINPSAGRPLGWLGAPAGPWLTVQSTFGYRIDAREYPGGVVLWNDDNDLSMFVQVSGWLGSSANLAGTGAETEGASVSTVYLMPRSGAVLKRPPAGVPTLPPITPRLYFYCRGVELFDNHLSQ